AVEEERDRRLDALADRHALELLRGRARERRLALGGRAHRDRRRRVLGRRVATRPRGDGDLLRKQPASGVSDEPPTAARPGGGWRRASSVVSASPRTFS